MIPSNAAQQRNMRLIIADFGQAVYRRSKIFIAFEDHQGGVAQLHRSLKTLQSRAYQVVKLLAAAAQHMHNHGSECGFSMAARYHYPRFVYRLLVDKFGISIYFELQGLRPQQFGIVGFGVHSQNNGIEVGGDALRKPTHFGGQQSGLSEQGA